MAITISGSGITSANIADGTIVNADVADLAASKLTGALPAIDGSALTGLGGSLAFRAKRLAGNQSLGTNTWTKVGFETETFDLGGVYDNVTNYRYTPTIAGYYHLHTQIVFYCASSAVTNRICAFYKNGAEVSSNRDDSVPGKTNSNMGLQHEDLVYFNGTTDYVEVYGHSVTQNGWANNGSTFSGYLVVGD
jgi:hypothetical protein